MAYQREWDWHITLVWVQWSSLRAFSLVSWKNKGKLLSFSLDLLYEEKLLGQLFIRFLSGFCLRTPRGGGGVLNTANWSHQSKVVSIQVISIRTQAVTLHKSLIASSIVCVWIRKTFWVSYFSFWLSQVHETTTQLNKLALKWLELRGICIKTTDNFNTKASLVPGSIVGKKG